MDLDRFGRILGQAKKLWSCLCVCVSCGRFSADRMVGPPARIEESLCGVFNVLGSSHSSILGPSHSSIFTRLSDFCCDYSTWDMLTNVRLVLNSR